MITLEQRFTKKHQKISQVSTLLLQQEVKSSVRRGAIVNLKPSQRELEVLSPLWNAVDTLILHNCFIDNNPMRVSGDDILFWEWTIVTVNGFSIPAPIHTCSKTESVLYTYNGREVILSNEECAYTTAIFYLDYLIRLALDWNRIKEKIHPILKMRLQPAVHDLQKLCAEEYGAILHILKGKLSDRGFSVLD